LGTLGKDQRSKKWGAGKKKKKTRRDGTEEWSKAELRPQREGGSGGGGQTGGLGTKGNKKIEINREKKKGGNKDHKIFRYEGRGNGVEAGTRGKGENSRKEPGSAVGGVNRGEARGGGEELYREKGKNI